MKSVATHRRTTELDQTPLAPAQATDKSTSTSTYDSPPSPISEGASLNRDPEAFYDLVVIGSGPAALALVSGAFAVLL